MKLESYNRYFAVSETDREWGMYTLDCGVSVVKPGEDFPAPEHPDSYKITWERGRVLNEYQLIYLISGTGIFESRTSGKISLTPGSIVLIQPGIWHRYKPDRENLWQTYWIGFGGRLVNHFVEKLGMDTKKPVKRIGYQKKIVQIFLDILETSQLEYFGYQQVLTGELLKLIGFIHAFHGRAEFKMKDTDRIIQKAKVILMQKKLSISIEEVAQELNIGYSTFRKLFKEYTGISPGQYQMQYKINKAISLLNEGRASVKEIAAELQFETPQYFARIFKKKTGKTPLEYRNQLTRKEDLFYK